MPKILSEEHKRKIAESMRNRKLSMEHKKKIAEAKRGSSFSEEHIKKLSESRKGKIYMTKSIMEEYIVGEIMEEKSVVLAFGRMNPPTIGHEKLVDKIRSVAKEKGASPQLYLSHSQDPKKNPLDYNNKIKFLRKAFGSIVQKSDDKNILHILKSLNGKYENVYIIAGSDRVPEFSNLANRYNGKDYTFKKIEIISAGDRDADSTDAVASMSASKLRGLAQKGDFETFKTGLPKKLQPMAKSVYDTIRNKMNINEGKKELGLWKYNKITGYWKLERNVTPETKDQWLKTFKEDEPKETFMISKTKPKAKPVSEEKIDESVKPAPFTKAQLDALTKNYTGIKTIDPDSPNYKKLTDMLDNMHDDNLNQLVAANVPWLGSLAKNTLRTRKYNKEQTMKTFPNVKYFTKDGHPDWKKHDMKEENIEEASNYKSKVLANKVKIRNLETDIRELEKKINEYKNMIKELSRENASLHIMKGKRISEETIQEISTEKLASYKKKAGEDASASDKKGDFDRGHKRFKGINRATRLQFRNETKKD